MVDSAHFKQILDGLLTAVLALDDELNLYCINNSAEILLGISGEHAIGKPIAYCFAEGETTPEYFREALTENRQFTMRRTRWRLHNQIEMTVDYSVTPNLESRTVIIEVQPLDRLLRISREEAMLSAQETSRHLIRSMAHEIKNPLGGIRGAAQLLARELSLVDTKDYEEYTGIIIDETDRLRNLVDRMLGPHKAPVEAPINLHEVLEHVIAVINAETGKSIAVLRDYDPSIPEVPADKEMLIQATLNIARNAVQVLTEGDGTDAGAITFSTRVQRRITIGRKQHPLVARMSISDNGPGIPPKIIEDIFLPMITGRAEGTGLGLAIAQNLISQHHGTIECESTPGSTKFSIFLPLE